MLRLLSNPNQHRSDFSLRFGNSKVGGLVENVPPIYGPSDFCCILCLPHSVRKNNSKVNQQCSLRRHRALRPQSRNLFVVGKNATILGQELHQHCPKMPQTFPSILFGRGMDDMMGVQRHAKSKYNGFIPLLVVQLESIITIVRCAKFFIIVYIYIGIIVSYIDNYGQGVQNGGGPKRIRSEVLQSFKAFKTEERYK